ncbi:MAG: tyrosine--tRNA ligase [Alphaproteobacteria bacterium]|nr:tyrosine--tRNA ligase [Alphaproteobacteria bacterium]MDE2110844.1 tyrosine--tRNA ligase [Alphaproteobacteria bacterium]
MTDAPNFNSEFLRTVVARGQYYDATDPQALDALFGKERVTAYIGFDCTAPSLHVGSLVQIMTLRRLQQAGHRPIVVMGGGTTKVGDPSGKDETRQILTPEQIEANKKSILRIFERFLEFGDGPSDAIMVDNAEWLDKLEYIPFLRDIGRHFSINRMLTMDSVKLRLDRDQPLSFLEFNYMILQSYDFVELYRRYGCKLQCGGSDQWGNIVSGTDLGRRVENTELFGLTSPLLTTASGAKMGKTAAGAVWLNADMCSPYDYWQYWRNTEDADVGRFLRLFTELPDNEAARLEAPRGAELNDAKKVLATEATALAHGRAAAEQAAETARRTFEEGAIDEGLPTFELARGKLEGLAVTTLTHMTGLTSSASEARRFIEGGGLRINDAAVKDVKATVGAANVTGKGFIKLSVGKKKHVLVKPV